LLTYKGGQVRKNIRIILKGKTQEVKLMLLIEVKVERVFT
jgi:hypothetical protein